MFKILEKAFIIFALIYFAGGLILILQRDNLPTSDEPPANSSMAMLHKHEQISNNDPTQKNPIKLGVEIFIYLTTAFLIVRNLRVFVDLALRHKLLWILLAVALLSALWSDVPSFTAKRGLVLLAATCFGVYLATHYTMRQIIRMMCVVGAIAAIGSFLVVWRMPDVGISGGATAGDWQGIFGQKNTLGRFMALETLVFAVATLKEERFRWVFALGALVSCGLLVMSRDISAAVLLPVLFGLIPVFHFARKYSLASIVTTLGVIGGTAAAFVFVIIIEPKKLLLMLGKDSTLSGRTEIWALVWQKVIERPWLGYGYSGFWLGKDGKESAGIWEALKWSVPHSHNGYLDVLVQLGAVGLLLFFVGYVVFFRQALRCARASKTVLGLFPLLYLSFMLLTNCTEGTILRDESIFWVLYAAIWVLTTRWLDLAGSRALHPARATRAIPNAAKRDLAPAWQVRSSNQAT
jgi:exopolysaccharide production protein ExoQ